jgi:hypothetical protein
MDHSDEASVPTPPVDRQGRPVRSSYPAAESGEPMSWTVFKVLGIVLCVAAILSVVAVVFMVLGVGGMLLAWMAAIGVFK